MGPVDRYVGPEMPDAILPWQGPTPAVDHVFVDDGDIADVKAKILASGATVSEPISAAWALASNYRDSDKRGGANGTRTRPSQQKDWTVNN